MPGKSTASFISGRGNSSPLAAATAPEIAKASKKKSSSDMITFISDVSKLAIHPPRIAFQHQMLTPEIRRYASANRLTGMGPAMELASASWYLVWRKSPLIRGEILRLSREQIQEIIPHRDPFVLIDEITEVDFGTHATGVVKDVANYHFFSELKSLGRDRGDLILAEEVDITAPGEARGVIKNVDDLKSLFEGHFPGQPTLPGALTLEALAEVAHQLVLKNSEFATGAFLKRFDGWRFRQVVVPGDRVELHAASKDSSRDIHVTAEVDGKSVAEGNITFQPDTDAVRSLPGQVTLPGALIIEAMAEVGAVAVLGKPEFKDHIAYLASVDAWEFHLPILAGEELVFEASIVKLRTSFGKGHIAARSARGLVCEGNLMFGLGPA